MRRPLECLRCSSPVELWEEDTLRYNASEEVNRAAGTFRQQVASRAAHPGIFSFRGRVGSLCYLCYEGLGHPAPVDPAAGNVVEVSTAR